MDAFCCLLSFVIVSAAEKVNINMNLKKADKESIFIHECFHLFETNLVQETFVLEVRQQTANDFSVT